MAIGNGGDGEAGEPPKFAAAGTIEDSEMKLWIKIDELSSLSIQL
jgi:hypothetical protein